MISKKSVIILGAGSSQPYGFPSGLELINEIITFLRKSEYLILLQKYGSLMKHLQKDNSVSSFLEDLINANPASIDDFLTFHSDNYDYQLIGKICILYCINKCENPNRFKPIIKTIQDKMILLMECDWYSILWQLLYQGANEITDLRNNSITFITFNYERSLEYFLKTSIEGLFSFVNKELIDDVLSNLPIYHIYGKIGEIVSEIPKETSEEFYKEYNSDNFISHFFTDSNTSHQEKISLFDKICKFTKKLWVYGKKSYDSLIFKNSSTALENADKIYFFGFSFHPQNMKILFPDIFNSKNNNIYISGTCYKMGINRVGEIENNFGTIFKNRIRELNFKDITTYQFMQDYGL